MHTNPLKILLVDDSSIVLQRIQQLLHEVFAVEQITIALDGEEAIITAQAHKPDIVLLDINLPKKSGLEVLRELKLTDGNIKIIMLTSQPADQYKDLCLQLGADAFIDKTSEFESVLDIIRQLMTQ